MDYDIKNDTRKKRDRNQGDENKESYKINKRYKRKNNDRNKGYDDDNI